LKLCTPQEVQWKPPLRQAAGTLAAMRGRQYDWETTKNAQQDERFLKILMIVLCIFYIFAKNNLSKK